MNKLIIGTRGSKLSLTQTHLVATQLQQLHPDLAIDIEIISTKGDRILDLPLSKVGDKGVFVKEIEQALLDGKIDLAVHSAKDLPSQLPDQLTLAAFPARADARDVLIIPANAPASGKYQHVYDVLPPYTRVGTSSLRRASQLLSLRPDLHISTARGNIDTRLRKLANGEHDAIILAAAGLARLGLLQMDGEISEFTLDNTHFCAYLIPNHIMLPAVGQGALAIETRADDQRSIAIVRALDDAPTRMCVLAERAFLRRIGGGCQLPNAAYAEFRTGQLSIRGLIASLDGKTIVRVELTDAGQSAAPAPEILGDQLGQQLLSHPLAQFVSLISHSLPPTHPNQAPTLHGKRIVITRPAERIDAFAQKLVDLGADVIRYPVIAYAALQDSTRFDAAMRAMLNDNYDWLAVTSVQSVRCMSAWLRQNHMHLPALRIAAIGEATAHECRLLNMANVLVPEHHDAAHLVMAMSSLPASHITIAASQNKAATLKTVNGLTGSRVLLLNADIARPTLQHQLERNGAIVHRVIAYHTINTPQTPDAALRNALLNGDIDAITFTSGSTVRGFVGQFGPISAHVAQTTKMVCIGPMTAQIAMEHGITDPIVANHASDDGMVEALIQWSVMSGQWSVDNGQ